MGWELDGVLREMATAGRRSGPGSPAARSAIWEPRRDASVSRRFEPPPLAGAFSGELVGGSQREESYEKLVAKMTEFGLDPEDYWWDLDLRKYGSVPHAGYGRGVDRLGCYGAAIENIRDSIPFPRYPGSAQF